MRQREISDEERARAGELQEVLELAERLRESHGGELNDATILAVAEACSVPVEVVRAQVGRMGSPAKKVTPLEHVRHTFLSLDPDSRRYVMSGFFAANLALVNVFSRVVGDQYGLLGVLMLILLALGVWNVAVSKDARTAAISGGIFGFLWFVARSLFSLVAQAQATYPAAMVLPFVALGAIGGVVAQAVVSKNRKKLGLADPVAERQELLRQLVSLQDKLREGEQSMTFLSADIVGSTKMKESADPLAVEFTFSEYHTYMDMAARRYGGCVHSTAGDGVICAFPSPSQAFAAARFVQAGLVELNTHRNRIGIPIRLRLGIHTGTVNAPAGSDVTKVNFSHVIDVTAHLQKLAPVGGIVVSEAAASLVPGGATSIGLEVVETEGVRARVWMPRRTLAGQSGEAPPAPSVQPPLA